MGGGRYAQAAKLVIAHLHGELAGLRHGRVLDEAACGRRRRRRGRGGRRWRQAHAKALEQRAMRLEEAAAREGGRLFGLLDRVVSVEALALLGAHRSRRGLGLVCGLGRWLRSSGGPLLVRERIIGLAREFAVPYGPFALLHVVHVLPLDGVAVDHDGRRLDLAFASERRRRRLGRRRRRLLGSFGGSAVRGPRPLDADIRG